MSRIIKELKETRCKMSRLLSNVEFVVVRGDTFNNLKTYITDSITNCLSVELRLRSSVSECCKKLEGFDTGKMEPVDYISSSDVKNKMVDISKGRFLVAQINLITGEIIQVVKTNDGEEKPVAEKS